MSDAKHTAPPAQADTARLTQLRNAIALGNGLSDGAARDLLALVDRQAQEIARLTVRLDDYRGAGDITANVKRRDANARLGAALRNVYPEIAAERVRQDEQWGGPAHDDRHSLGDWRSYRQRFEQQVLACVWGGAGRDGLIKIAALAVAQIESLDRIAALIEQEGK